MTKGLVRANNFSDLADKDEAVVNLGLSAADYAALKGLYTTAGIDFAVIGEIGNSQGNYQTQLDGIGTTLSGVVLSGYVNRSGDTILGTWTHSGIINISSGLPSGYPASTDSLFSLSIESGEAVIVASGLIASGLSYNGVRQSSSTVQRAFPPSGFSPLHLIPLQVGGQSFFAEAGESPSFHIAPARTGHALDLVTGNLLGSYNSASPALAVGPDGVLFQPAANAPVVDYDPTTLACLGARIREVVTNQILDSTDLSAASYTKTATTVSASGTGPDNQTAYAVNEAISTTSHTIGPSTVSVTSGVTYTGSIFLKRSTVDWVQLTVGNAGFSNSRFANFNLATGAIGIESNCTGFIEPYPNGWYRCSIRVLAVATATSNSLILAFTNNTNSATRIPSYAGSTSNEVLAALVAFTATSGPAPYVPTTTLAASSTADVWDITSLTAGINNLKTLYFRGRTSASGTRGIASLNDNSSSNRLELSTSGTDPKATAVTSGSTVADLNGGTIAANTTFRLAVRFDTDSYAISFNGGAVVTDTSGARALVDRLFIGRDQAGNYMNGYLEEFAGWTRACTDAQLPALAAS